MPLYASEILQTPQNESVLKMRPWFVDVCWKRNLELFTFFFSFMVLVARRRPSLTFIDDTLKVQSRSEALIALGIFTQSLWLSVPPLAQRRSDSERMRMAEDGGCLLLFVTVCYCLLLFVTVC